VQLLLHGCTKTEKITIIGEGRSFPGRYYMYRKPGFTMEKEENPNHETGGNEDQRASTYRFSHW